MVDQPARSVKGTARVAVRTVQVFAGAVPRLERVIYAAARGVWTAGPPECGLYGGGVSSWESQRTRAQHEELMAKEGYRLVRDTPLARVLPWRILEFQHG